MKPLELRDRWVLVTGASAGLGREMARRLAREYGANLVLVARRLERLTELKDELEREAGVEVHPVSADLSRPEDVDRAFEQATSRRELQGVVLNAGVTYYGRALDLEPAEFAAMLQTNVHGLVRLARASARYFEDKQNEGGILLVSSMAGFAPLPWQTAYAATKAFVTSYGRGLAEELRGQPVSVTVFAPGGIDTEMLVNSGLSRQFKPGAVGIMPADECAERALRAFVKRRELAVPGALNLALALTMKLLPHSLFARAAARTYAAGLPPRPLPAPAASRPTESPASAPESVAVRKSA